MIDKSEYDIEFELWFEEVIIPLIHYYAMDLLKEHEVQISRRLCVTTFRD